MRLWRSLENPLLVTGGLGRSLASAEANGFHWTAPKIVLSLFLFVTAGLAEIGGGWLVWQAVRGRAHVDGKQWWKNQKAILCIALGSLCLVGYGFLPTAQPPPTFGRLYAVYGGVFIVMSFGWGWIVDKDRPDKGIQLACVSHSLPSCLACCTQPHVLTGDYIGGLLAVGGVAVAWFYPR